MRLTSATVQRFPVSVVAATVMTACGVFAFDRHGDAAQICNVIGMVAALVMVWGVMATVATERRGMRWAYGASVAVVVVGLLYYVSLPRLAYDFLTIHGARTGILIAVGFLLLAIAPFMRRRTENRSLWFFVLAVCMRFVFAFIVAATLYAGIAASMASVQYLFGVNVAWEWYARVWIVMAGFVAPMVFMAGIAHGAQMDDADTRVAPRVVRIFAQYVLIPLMALYTVILYAYGVKIAVTRTWPEGGVGYMVLIFASVGLVTVLLLAVDHATRRWVRVVTHVFAAIALPTLALLGGAIGIRIAQYGWTPLRYTVVLLGVWYAGVWIYFLIRRTPDIRVPFASLAIVGLFSLCGPWGMFAVSAQSQVARLAELVDRENIRTGGVIARSEDVRELPWARAQAIRSRIQVIVGAGREDAILEWFAPDARPDLSRQKDVWTSRSSFATSQIMDAMGVTEGAYVFDKQQTTIFYTADDKGTNRDVVDVTGYHYYIPSLIVQTQRVDDDEMRTWQEREWRVMVDGVQYTAVMEQPLTLQLVRVEDGGDMPQKSVTASYDLTGIVTALQEAQNNEQEPQNLDTITLHNEKHTFTCQADHMTLEDVTTTPRVTDMTLQCRVR